MKASRYDVFNSDVDHLTYAEDPNGEWVMADAHDQVVALLEAEVERLTVALREEQGESLRQAEIARAALVEVERLRASVPTLPDIQTAVSAARCWAKRHDAPDGRIDAACARLIETLRPRLAALPTEGGDEP